MILRQKRMEMPYPDRLKQLNWCTLQSRRDYLLISFVAKTLYRNVTCISVAQHVRVNPRHIDDVKFCHLSARNNCLHHNPIHVFPRLWETLPQTIRRTLSMGCLSQFLSQLKVQCRPNR